MSIASISSSASSSALGSLLDSSFASQIVNSASSSDTERAFASAASPQSNIASDFTSLLKDLASGDVSQSKSDLTKLEADLQSADPSSTALGSGSSSTSPLSKLLANLSNSLDSGNTTDALKDLVTFLVQNGSSTGNAVNTTA